MALEVHDLIFGSVSALDYGIYIRGSGVYDAPARAVELIDIPGRNGSLTIDKGHYENITIEYPCFTYAEDQVAFRQKLNAYKNAILSQTGYQKLADTYQPDEYRMAIYASGLEVEPTTFNRSGDFTLKFNCKPQRYLADGQQPIEVNDDDVVVNPTLYEASPLLMVNGYGDIEFNGYKVTIENATMGDVIMWNRATLGSDVSYYSLSFDKNLFNDGDSFTFTMTCSIHGSGVIAKSSSDSGTHTGSGTAKVAYLRGGYYEVEVTNNLEVTHVIGTSSQVDDVFTMTFHNTSSGSDETLIIRLTSNYGGDDSLLLHFAIGGTLSVFENTKVPRYTQAIGDSSIPILGHPTYIDCEIGEAYKYVNGSLVGLNSYIDLGSDLPKLSSGNNTFTLSNTITSLIVVPRWWQL